MQHKTLIVAAMFCVVLAGFGYVEAQNSSRQSAQATAAANAGDKEYVPAYHAEAPRGPLPATIDPTQFLNVQDQNIYALAAKVKAVLYQQPCYCHCDTYNGHKSLLDCFVDRHASMCTMCKKEAVYAYLQSQKGKTPAEIRKGIMDGQWKDVDLSTYRTSTPSK